MPIDPNNVQASLVKAFGSEITQELASFEDRLAGKLG
jgi:hypothetical protein